VPEFPVSVDIPVRFRDCDPMGHVNNAVYLTYLEVGRQAYWSRFLQPLRYDEVPFIIARVEIDYRSPAEVGETVRVSLRIPWVSRRSFGAEYEIREAVTGRLVAQATSVQVTYDYARRTAMPVPEDLRRHLEEIEGRKIPGPPE
jgi:acyl-CoA thioester hydrolase